MQNLGFDNGEKPPKLLSKKEYYERDTVFKVANMQYSEYLEYMTLQWQMENIDDYAVWQTGMEESENEDEEESEPCGACMALSGQVFHIDNIPKKPHKHCKCGTVPLRLHINFAQIDERLDELEGKVRKIKKNWSDMTEEEKEEARIKELDKFMKSEELRGNVKETKRYSMVSWVNNVRPGGDWDYKQGGKRPEMEHVGNFNYGATGRALGIPPSVLKGAGGVVQIAQGTSDWNFYDSYFDDPVDQGHIQQGIDWYDESYGKSSSSYNWNFGDYDADSGNIDWDFYE
jgi:hypothetical protein